MKNLFLFVFLMTPVSILLPSHWKTIYAHGVIDGPSQMSRFTQAIATKDKIAVSFLDAQPATGFGLNYGIFKLTQLFGKHVNRAHMHMGQDGDITSLRQTIQIASFNGDRNKYSLILYGCSRGAATILNYMSQYNHPEVKALVLDASPASMHEMIQPILIKIGINPTRALSIFNILFPAYPKNAITPLQSIKKIQNKKLPILLIHSLDDTVVPYEHSLMLYQELLAQGFTNAHLITLPTGKHSFLLQDQNANPDYLKAVHSFYKKYDLPYDASWAAIDLATYAIDPQMVSSKIDTYKKLIQNKSAE